MSNTTSLGNTGGGGTGDVVGPASSLDNQMVVFDGLTGKLIKGAPYIVDPVSGVISRDANGDPVAWGITDAATGTAVLSTTITTLSTGAVTAGFGSIQEELIQNDAGNTPIAFQRTVTYIDPTDGAEYVGVDYSILVNGVTTSIYTYNGTEFAIKVPLETTSGRIVKIRLYTAATLDSSYAFVLVDTSAAPQTMTLPAAPIDGQQYQIGDGIGNASVNNITIDGNGKNILAITSAATYVISTDGAVVTVTYSDDINQWKLS
jgi:hypothetical protein